MFLLSWVCTRNGVSSVIFAGFVSSDCGYSLLGGIHVLAQTLSYEVRLAFILLSFVFSVCAPWWDLNPQSQQASGRRPTP